VRKIFVEINPGSWKSIQELASTRGRLRTAFWKRLDGGRLRYTHAPIRFFYDDPYWALLASYVSGDGDLTRDSGVRFYDRERDTLDVIRKTVSEKLEYEFPRPSFQLNQYGRGEWVIKTRHSAVHFILIEFYRIPIGRKKRGASLPLPILISKNTEVKRAAIAGSISSDGYVSSHKSKGRFIPTIGVLSTISAVKACAIYRLLKDLGYHSDMFTSTYPSPFTGRPVTQIGVVVHRHFEVVQLFFDTMPYLVKPSRVQKWLQLLADTDFYKRVRIRSPRIPPLLRKASMKTSGHRRRYLHILVDIASLHGIGVGLWGAKHWTKTHRVGSVPLPVIVECCRILGENLLEYVSAQLAPLLWLHEAIDYGSLVALRGMEPVLDLERMATALFKSS